MRGRVVIVEEMIKNGGALSVGDGDAEMDVATVLVTPPNTRAWNPFVARSHFSLSRLI